MDYCEEAKCAEYLPCPTHSRPALKTFGWSKATIKQPVVLQKPIRVPDAINVFKTAPSVLAAKQKREKRRSTEMKGSDGDGQDDDDDEDDDISRVGNVSMGPEQRRKRAEMLRTKGDQFAEEEEFIPAVRAWREALFYSDDNEFRGTLYEQLAQVLMEVDQLFNAVVAAEEAVKLRPSWSVAYLTLSRAQLQWGDPDVALTSLEKGLDIDSDNSELKESLEQLKAILSTRPAREEGASDGPNQPQIAMTADT